MAQTDVPITPGSGTNIDGFATTGTGNIRQAVVIGDPSTDADVAGVTAAGALKVDNSANTQPVSVTSLPLPSGAATAANQSTANTSLSAIATSVAGAIPPGGNTIGAVEITDNTNDANVLNANGTAAGQNALIIANQMPNASTATWGTSQALNSTLAINTIGLGTVMLSSIETGTTTTAGALTFEVYDGTNWWAVNGQQVGNFTLQSSYTLVNGTNVAWSFDVAGFQQFRARLSTAITGTGTPQVVLIAQAQAAPNDVAPSVGLAQKLDSVNDSITNYPFGHSYLNITAGQATTTVKSGAGVLHAIVYNTAAAATSTMVIYDNTAASGTKIGSPTLATGITAPTTVLYDLAFSTGLTIITATANGADMTVIYR